MHPLTAQLRDFYDSHGIPYRELEHGPTTTSEQSAAVRNEPLHVGGKALLLKCTLKPTVDAAPATPGLAEERWKTLRADILRCSSFVLVVIPADQQFDSALVRNTLGIKKLRFATADELRALTGLVPGSVPPYGEPLLPFPLVVDPKLCDNDRIAYNAGSLTVSHILAMPDYLRIAQPYVSSVVRG